MSARRQPPARALEPPAPVGEQGGQPQRHHDARKLRWLEIEHAQVDPPARAAHRRTEQQRVPQQRQEPDEDDQRRVGKPAVVDRQHDEARHQPDAQRPELYRHLRADGVCRRVVGGAVDHRDADGAQQHQRPHSSQSMCRYSRCSSIDSWSLGSPTRLAGSSGDRLRASGFRPLPAPPPPRPSPGVAPLGSWIRHHHRRQHLRPGRQWRQRQDGARTPLLLRKIGFHHVLRDRGGQIAMLGVLTEHDARDLGRTGRAPRTQTSHGPAGRGRCHPPRAGPATR